MRILILSLLLSLSLAACAAPQSGGAQDAGGREVATNDADASSTTAPTTSPQRPKVGERIKMPPLGGPLPPQRVTEPVQVDRSCRSDADCTVKNVGNCCGYYPACVNQDSPTDPAGVQAQCAKDGMASVCGFPEIAGCQCVDGQCAAADASGA